MLFRGACTNLQPVMFDIDPFDDKTVPVPETHTHIIVFVAEHYRQSGIKDWDLHELVHRSQLHPLRRKLTLRRCWPRRCWENSGPQAIRVQGWMSFRRRRGIPDRYARAGIHQSFRRCLGTRAANHSCWRFLFGWRHLHRRHFDRRRFWCWCR